MNHELLQSKWVRSNQGWVAGVCQGLGERFEVSPAILRLIWVASILFFGVGFFLYIIAAFCLPVEGKEVEAMDSKLLGVCARLSQRLNMDVGLLRMLAVIIFFSSVGTTLLGYIILHFLIPVEHNEMKTISKGEHI